MTLSRRKIAIIVVGLAIVGGLGGAAYGLHLGPFKAEDLGPVIAEVNGHPIYLSEAKSRVEGLSSVHGNVEKTLGGDWPQIVLQSLVDDQIVEAEARTRGINVSDSEVAVALSNVEQMFPTPADFQKWLDEQRMTIDELERRIRLQTVGARVYEAVTVGVQVDSGQIRAYYRSHRDEYVGADGSALPFSAVRSSLRDKLEKQAKDRTYGTWLEEQRQRANVVVVVDDWWKELS